MNFRLRYTYVIVCFFGLGYFVYHLCEYLLRPNVPVNVYTKIIYEEGHDIVRPGLCLGVEKRPKVLVGVISAPENRQRRMSIRKTWGNVSHRKDLVIGFFIGRSHDAKENFLTGEESIQYNDIVRGKSIDSYLNLTLKTVSFLEWTSRYCKNVQFVLKVDDDVFVNVDNLLSFVEAKWDDKKTIFGELGRNLGPLWWPPKWYVSSLEYDRPKYPDFLFGPAYLITSDSVPWIYRRSLHTRFFKLEDVFITGIVAESMKIKRVDSPFFIRWQHTKVIVDNSFDMKTEAKFRITIHGVGYDEQAILWDSIAK